MLAANTKHTNIQKKQEKKKKNINATIYVKKEKRKETTNCKLKA